MADGRSFARRSHKIDALRRSTIWKWSGRRPETAWTFHWPNNNPKFGKCTHHPASVKRTKESLCETSNTEH